MAVSKEYIKSNYPLPAYNYRVTVLEGNNQEAGAGAELTVISCSEVRGLSMAVETVTYRDGLSFLVGPNIIPAQNKEVNLTIKKGVTSTSSFFSEWMGLIYPLVLGDSSLPKRKRNLLIDLCDEEGNPVVRWTAMKAMPTKLDAPDFNASTNEVAFEELQLIAHQLKVEYLQT